VDLLEDGQYLRVLPAPDGLALIRVANRGSLDAPDLCCELLSGSRAARIDALERTLRNVLGLDVDPGPLERLSELEPRLAPTVHALRGMRPPRFPELFEAFASVIPFQQLSLSAGVAIVGRMVERFGRALAYRGRMFRAFPAAEAIADCDLDALKQCGLTARKAEALRSIAKLVAMGQLSEQGLAPLSSAEAIQQLCALPGIGPWSAGLVLLRGLGRLDVFPPGDVGATRGLRAIMGVPEQSLAALVQRAGATRGYLYFCALGGALLAQGLIRPS
jgi:DNA-3-methyladenine glycosylase II